MYTQIWKKYLPIIKILLKKSLAESQVLPLNRIDFERAGSARKTSSKFKIDFTNGKVSNIISGSALASQLAQEMLEDDSIKQILQEHDFQIVFNTHYELLIKHV